MLRSWTYLRALCRWPKKNKQRPGAGPLPHASSGPSRRSLTVTPRLIIDILALLILLAGIVISPPLVVVFMCWIEWYIRNDGSTNEAIIQVGQWPPLVSVVVVLLAAVVCQLKGKLASKKDSTYQHGVLSRFQWLLPTWL